MNPNTDVILNQNGEATDLTAPADFGQGMAFLDPASMPDLDAAEVGFNIQPESIEFNAPGEKIRAVFNGFTTFRVKDQANKGQYIDKKTAVLQTKNGIKINMGANLIKQLELVPAGTAIQITFKGEEKTNGGNKVKVYEVMTLNVPRSNVPAPVQVKQTALHVEQVPQYINSQMASQYWTLVYSDQYKFTEQEGKDHLAECGNDFKMAIAALSPDYPF